MRRVCLWSRVCIQADEVGRVPLVPCAHADKMGFISLVVLFFFCFFDVKEVL